MSSSQTRFLFGYCEYKSKQECVFVHYDDEGYVFQVECKHDVCKRYQRCELYRQAVNSAYTPRKDE